MGAQNTLAGFAGSYEPSKPANWTAPKPTTIQDGLDALAAAGTSTGGIVAFARFVSVSGSDVTGNGGIFTPFATIQAAYTSITTASSAQIWIISVLPGEYAAPFAVKPWISLVGAEGLSLNTNSSDAGAPVAITAPQNTVTLDASWAGGATEAAWISNLSFENAQTFTRSGTMNPSIVMRNVCFAGEVQFLGGLNELGSDGIIMNECTFSGTFNLVGWGSAIFVNCNVDGPVTAACGANGVKNTTIEFVNSASTSVSISDGAFALPHISAAFFSSTCNQLTTSGPHAFAIADQAGVTSAFTRNLSAPAASWPSYVATTLADWSNTGPSSLANALDRIAAGARAYTPTNVPNVVPTGMTTMKTTPKTIIAIDFTPVMSGTTQVMINLDLQMNQADTVLAEMWVVAPLTNVANANNVAAPAPSQGVNGCNSNTGIVTTPAPTTGDLACKNQTAVTTTPFETNVSISAMLNLTAGVRTLIAVVVTMLLDTTTMSANATVMALEQPLR